MRRYLSLYFIFFHNCLLREMEYRFNFLVLSLINIIWLGLLFLSVNLIFGEVQAIAGWKKEEVLVLVTVQMLFFDLTEILIRDNFRRFSHLIRHGDLDFVLLKPVSARFFVSSRYFDFSHFARFFILFPLLFLLLQKIGANPSWANWLGASFLFFLGFVIFYSFFFILTTSNFWLTRLFNLDELHVKLLDVGRYPPGIFRGKLKFFFVYLVPVGFIAAFPTLALLGRINYLWFVYGVALAIVFFAASQWFWRFALKHYSSASS